MPDFASGWDSALAAEGPPAIFTLDREGRLRVDPERTREVLLLGPLTGPREAAHYVLTDTVTGVRMYLFVSHPQLAERQPRGTAERFPDGASAVAHVRAWWAERPGASPA